MVEEIVTLRDIMNQLVKNSEQLAFLRSDVADLSNAVRNRKKSNRITTAELARICLMTPRTLRARHVGKDIFPLPGHKSLFDRKEGEALARKLERLRA